MSARYKAYFYLIIVAAIWGMAGPIIKYTLTDFPTPIFLAYRFLLSSLVLIPIFFHSHLLHHFKALSPHDWFILILNSLLGSSIELGLLFWGFSYTTSLDGTLIGCTSPIMTAIACHFILRERINRREQLGMGIAFIGSILLVLEPLIASGKLLSGNLFGNFLIFTSIAVWVAHTIITKKQLRHRLPPLFLTTCMFVFGFISMAVVLPFFHSPTDIINSLTFSPFSSHLGVWYMAIFSGSLAYFLYQKAEKTIEVSEANLFTYLHPIFALPLSIFWLHEPLSSYLLIGCIIIAGGVLLAQTRSHRS